MISNLSNLVARRDLLRELVRSELRSSTAETRLGWLWWFLDPLLLMLIYWAIVVGVLGRGKEQYAPYPVFLLCAIITWKHFASAAGTSTRILRAKEPLIKAIPFPTMVLPLSQVLSNFLFFSFGIAVVFVASMLVGGQNHSGDYVPLVQVPALMALQIVIVAGFALPLSCFGALLTDLSGLIVHLLRIGFYMSPGLFGIDMVRDALKRLDPKAAEIAWLPENLSAILFSIYMLNPFAILITGYRNAIFYGQYLEWRYWLILLIEAVILSCIGYRIFQHYDRRVIKFI
ncbi:MAG: ABC transporter permease [Planctomycetota bacterium]|nr:ABC transporter permease [Planctomycetota bacterium]